MTDGSRIINLEYEPNKLPFASQPPLLEDLLPLIPGDNATSHPVSTDLITPDMTVESEIELFNRPFTKLGNFGSTIQATYLTSLVTHHTTSSHPSLESREEEAKKLDAALQSFACTLIPPPGRADGQYCGAYGLRSLCVPPSPLPSLRIFFLSTLLTDEGPCSRFTNTPSRSLPEQEIKRASHAQQ
jgi:hypothetical protein